MKDKRELWAILLLISVTTLSCLPLFKNIGNINSHVDWLQMLSYYRADRESILEYHQLPLRTYYFGGGFSLIANPQDGFLNPFFIPVLIFGEVVGLKINVFLAHLIAALGMFYLARKVLKYNYTGALFSACVFCFGGHLHRLMIRGQDYISCFYNFFIPLSLAFFIKAKESKRYLIYTVFILVVIITQAGLYFIPILLFIFLFCCLETVKRENKKIIFETEYIKNFFIILSFVFLLSAVKTFLMIELLKQNTRSVDSYNPFWGPFWPNVYKSIFVHQRNFSSAGMHWSYFYLGYLPVILSGAAFLIYWKKNLRYLVLLAVFTLLSFGAHTRLDLFKFLWRLPIFHSIEAPVRYFVPSVIFIIAVTSGSIFLLKEKIKLKLVNMIFISVLTFTAADLIITNGAKDESFPLAVPKYAQQEPFFQVRNLRAVGRVSPFIPKNMFRTRIWEWSRPSQYELMLQNTGKINWYGNIHLGEYVTPKYFVDWDGVESLDIKNYSWHLNPDYKGELYYLNNANNKAEYVYFSPCKIIVKADLTEPDTLVINQNYDKYWKAGQGISINYKGLLAIDLKKKGQYLIEFNYRPLNFYLGLSVSLATLFFLLWILMKKGKLMHYK